MGDGKYSTWEEQLAAIKESIHADTVLAAAERWNRITDRNCKVPFIEALSTSSEEPEKSYGVHTANTFGITTADSVDRKEEINRDVSDGELNDGDGEERKQGGRSHESGTTDSWAWQSQDGREEAWSNNEVDDECENVQLKEKDEWEDGTESWESEEEDNESESSGAKNSLQFVEESVHDPNKISGPNTSVSEECGTLREEIHSGPE